MELRVADNRIGKRIGAEKRMTDAICAEGWKMSCKILIVEDDSNIAKYIQACLTIGGYDSEICSDGLSAVERACGGAST